MLRCRFHMPLLGTMELHLQFFCAGAGRQAYFEGEQAELNEDTVAL